MGKGGEGGERVGKRVYWRCVACERYSSYVECEKRVVEEKEGGGTTRPVHDTPLPAAQRVDRSNRICCPPIRQEIRPVRRVVHRPDTNPRTCLEL